MWSSPAEDTGCHWSWKWMITWFTLGILVIDTCDPLRKLHTGYKMKSKACRWKINPPDSTPPLGFYRTSPFFHRATWKCFMDNLRDTWGYHLWSRVRTLDSSNTSPVSVSLGKTANLPLIRKIVALSVPSVSVGWGLFHTVQHKSHMSHVSPSTVSSCMS